MRPLLIRHLLSTDFYSARFLDWGQVGFSDGRNMTMSASIETKIHLLPHAESRLISALQAKLGELRRVFAQELSCEHNELVFDEINDVSCRDCGKDFTG